MRVSYRCTSEVYACFVIKMTSAALRPRTPTQHTTSQTTVQEQFAKQLATALSRVTNNNNNTDPSLGVQYGVSNTSIGGAVALRDFDSVQFVPPSISSSSETKNSKPASVSNSKSLKPKKAPPKKKKKTSAGKKKQQSKYTNPLI